MPSDNVFKNTALTPAKEVASAYNYTPDYVSKLAREGKIEGQKIRGSWWVRKASLEEFFQKTQAEKEARRRQLSEVRHQEYRSSKKSQKNPSQSGTNIFALTFARTLAAVVGAFVFLFSFTVGYAVVGTPASQLTGMVTKQYISVGQALYNFSSHLFDEYVVFVRYGVPRTPYAYELFTDHLAALWTDRALVMEELARDRVALRETLASGYASLGVQTRSAIEDSLLWYRHTVLDGTASAVASSADWFRSTATIRVVGARDAAASAAGRAAVGAVSFSGDTTLAFSWNPLSWVRGIGGLFNAAPSDEPPTVIIREEQHDTGTPTPTVTTPGTVVRNVTEAVTVSGISESQLTTRLQVLENTLRSEIYETAARADRGIGGNYRAIQLTNVIDTLDGVTITNPTIIGGSISGTSGISGGGGGSGSGTVNSGLEGYFAYFSADGTTVDDQSVLYTDGTNIGIGTAAPSTRLDIDVPTDISGDLTISGGSSLTVSATGPVNQTGTGQVTFAGNVNATNGLDVTVANLTVGGSSFTVAPGSGDTTIGGILSIDGALRASSTAQFDSASRFYSTLQVDGALTAAGSGTGLIVSNNASIGGTLAVTSAATFGSNAVISGTLSAGATTLSGDLELSDNKITGLANPTDNQEAANKQYVDAVAQGLDLKDSVRVATTENITLSGEQTIDGVSAVSGDRVLVKDQTDATQNGIYVVAGGSWSRSTDADETSEVSAGMFTFIQEGTLYANSGWVLTTPGAVTLGSTSLAFSQFSGAGQITAGTGLTKSGNTLNVGGTADRITANADTIDIASTYVGQSSITTVGTLTSGALGSGFGNIDIGASSITAGAATFSSIEGSAITGSGNLSVSGTGSFTDDVTISGELTVATTTFTGDIALSGKKITGLADPTAAQEAATKAYVDAIAQGLTVKASVRAASTGNLTLSGEQTVDGVSLSAGDRILVKDQSTATENGIYVVASGAWSRSTDADENSEVVSGLYAFVEEGTTQANTGWSIITEDPITLGSTSITLTQFSGSNEVTAGDGLTKSGNTLNIGGTADRITVDADTVDIASTYVGQSSITTVGALASGSITSAFGTINIGTSALTAGAGTFTSLTNYGTLSIGGTATTTISGNGATSTFSGGITLADGGVNIATGGQFLINDALVLDATSLGSGIVSSSLTSVGALDSGQITTGFGDINIGTNLLGAGTTTITNLVVQNSSTSTFAGPLTSASGDFFIAGASSADDLIVNRYGGNVGVGTSSPVSKLTVEGSSAAFDAGATGDFRTFISKTTASDVASVIFSTGGSTLSQGWAEVGTLGTNDLYLKANASAGTYGDANILIQGSTGNVGIGTTTPQWALNAYAADAPQLVLSDGAGAAQWAFRNSGGTLYLATTTVAGTATSSLAALTIGTDGTLTTLGDFSVGNGTGKITVGTIDPVYTIDGVAYATYVAGMIGQKEEVTGSVVIDTETTDSEGNVGYTHVIDFDEEETGSDLWLFGRATQINKNIDKLVALLTPEGNTDVWYEVNKAENQIILLAHAPTRVSFRFTAPRFDYEQWTNYNHDGVTGFTPPDIDESFYTDPAPQFSFGGGVFSTVKEKVVLWFADIGNGIGDVFARAFNASEKICVDGECLTRDDIRSLKQLASGGALSPSGNTDSGATTTSSQAPIVEVLGNNPATIAVGSTYADLGATFADDKDSNLGIHTFIDGVEVSTITLDTASSTTYEIMYRVTDTDGNVGEATRTVVVGDDDQVETTTANTEEPEGPVDEEETGETAEKPPVDQQEAVEEDTQNLNEDISQGEIEQTETQEVVENDEDQNEDTESQPEE